MATARRSASAADSVALAPVEALLERIRERTATIGIVGLGYAGLPLAIELAGTYAKVKGFDTNHERVARVNEGASPVADVTDEALAAAVRSRKLEASDDFTGLADCDVVIICVQTPLEKSKDPDLSFIRSAAQEVEATLRPGQLVILESTTYPGTTEELLLSVLQEKGLKLDEDFLLAFAPERIDHGSNVPLREIPVVVGGCSKLSTEAARELYAPVVVSVHPVSSARVAETVKLIESTFRLVNIALVNEFAILCNHLRIDTNEVIHAAATKPFGFMPFFPGPGAGGHHIPLDPLYLSWKATQAGFHSRFIELADEINTGMAAYVVDLITAALNARSKAVRDSRILVVGVTYKPDVDDTRQSPAIAVIDRLRARGAYVAYHDPLVPVLNFDFHDWPEWRPRTVVSSERRSLTVLDKTPFSRRRRYDALQSIQLVPKFLNEADCVVILTKHTGVDYSMIARHSGIIVDTRDAIGVSDRAESPAHIIRL